MKKIAISILLMLVSALFLTNCQRNNQDKIATIDSLFLQKAHAQTESSQGPPPMQEVYQSRQNTITRAVSQASPAVVGISVIEIRRYRYRQRNPFYEDPFWRYFFPELYRDRIYEQPVRSLGSGFIISQDGYILTNDHVAGEGDEIVVTMAGGEKHNAKIMGTDKVSDVTLLKIEGDDFPHLPVGSSENLIVGEWVIALGNPFGLFEYSFRPTVTVGVISAVDFDWGRDNESGRVYMDMIQTDAAINVGNSGGPLVNANGEVIGMNTFIFTGSRYQQGFVGIGFAIPANRIKKIVSDIRSKGGVNRNYWLGFKLQNLNPILIRALGIKVKEGVIVTEVDPGSSADKAGFQTEDVIIRINDQPVKDTDSAVNILAVMDLQVSDTLQFDIIRGGKEMKMKMKLIEK